MIKDFFQSFKKAVIPSNLTTVSNRGGWRNLIREPFPGAWQRNLECSQDDALSHYAVYSCITLIANDISKLPLKLRQKNSNGIWEDVENPAYSAVLRRPNHYQDSIQFIENWVISILRSGNTYILKKRDERGVVNGLYILDPDRVIVRVTSRGEIWYELMTDNMSDTQLDYEGQNVFVPPTEIIHDRMNCIYHQLVGVSPLFAAGGPVAKSLYIEQHSANFFANGSRPGGILYAEGALDDEDVAEMARSWNANYTGANAGKTAVLADGLKYQAIDVQTASDSQLLEQLQWTTDVVCSVFHVPKYMITGEAPAYDNVQALNQQYYAQALQRRITSIESMLGEGLGLSNKYQIYLDIEVLLKMDTAAFIESEKIAVGAGIKSPNESRKKLNLNPVDGGESPMIQEQNYSLAAIAKRDAREDPFAKGSSASNDRTSQEAEDVEVEEEITRNFTRQMKIKALERFANV